MRSERWKELRQELADIEMKITLAKMAQSEDLKDLQERKTVIKKEIAVELVKEQTEGEKKR